MPIGIYIRTDEARKNIGLAKKGKTWEELYGKEKAKDMKVNLGLTLTGRVAWNKGLRGKQIAWNKGKTWVEMYGIEKAAKYRKNLSLARTGEKNSLFGKHGYMFNKKHTEEVKKKNRLDSLKNWQNPLYAQKVMKALHIKPNKPETFLNNFLNTLLPKEYKYVGDGEFILAGKCPDFVNVNGQKKIIELFGDYWHRNDVPEDRIDLFKQYGYSTLIVWEKELANIKELENKVLSFNMC